MFKPIKGEHGFTLVELMITVNILGVLSAIAIQSSLTYLDRAREKIAKENLRAFRQAINLYNLDTGNYPSKLVIGDYYKDSPKKKKAQGGRGGGNEIFPDGYKYLKKVPYNQMPGEDDDHPLNWVTQFDDADTSEYQSAFSANWDGWFYYYKINGVETGALVVPRSGNDVEGIPYSEW